MLHNPVLCKTPKALDVDAQEDVFGAINRTASYKPIVQVKTAEGKRLFLHLDKTSPKKSEK